MGENGVCPCELFMEYEGMGRTNVGKGYTQMLLREKRDVKVMAKEVCTNAPSAPVTATAPHRWLKTIENKFADVLRIPSLCRCPQCGGNDRRSYALRGILSSMKSFADEERKIKIDEIEPTDSSTCVMHASWRLCTCRLWKKWRFF